MPVTRIIAGRAKGRRLRTPAHSATRPTTDRVREAAFSLVADWAGTLGGPAEEQLVGIAFLDLYAGTGAIALEAASRGASPVSAIESDPATARIAQGNAREAGLPVTVVATTVEKALAGMPSEPFDVVWAGETLEHVAALRAGRGPAGAGAGGRGRPLARRGRAARRRKVGSRPAAGVAAPAVRALGTALR